MLASENGFTILFEFSPYVHRFFGSILSDVYPTEMLAGGKAERMLHAKSLLLRGKLVAQCCRGFAGVTTCGVYQDPSDGGVQRVRMVMIQHALLSVLEISRDRVGRFHVANRQEGSRQSSVCAQRMRMPRSEPALLVDEHCSIDPDGFARVIGQVCEPSDSVARAEDVGMSLFQQGGPVSEKE